MIGRYVWRDCDAGRGAVSPRRTDAGHRLVLGGLVLHRRLVGNHDSAGHCSHPDRHAARPVRSTGNRIRLTQQTAPSQLQPGQRGHVTLVLANNSSRPANEVVIRDEPSAPLTYVPKSMIIDGAPMPDPAGEFPLAQGEAKVGMNLGTVPARSKITLEYDVVVDSGVESVPAPGPTASFSSREIGVLVKANTSNRWTWPSWRASSARSRMLPEQSHCRSWISSRARSRPAPSGRQRRFASSAWTVDTSRETPPSALSTDRTNPALDYLGAEAAWRCQLVPVLWCRYVPGRSQPIGVRISGITDVSQAKSLFYSRQESSSSSLFASSTVIVGPDLFAKTIMPAFQNVTTTPAQSSVINRSSKSTSLLNGNRSTPIPTLL